MSLRARGVEACARCGSADLRIPGMGDGVVLGVGMNLSLQACVRCGHVGVPITFDSEAARAAFERGQARRPAAAADAPPAKPGP
jgi:hypothetical protein